MMLIPTDPSHVDCVVYFNLFFFYIFVRVEVIRLCLHTFVWILVRICLLLFVCCYLFAVICLL